MPTAEYANLLYPKFGVKKYHDMGIFGKGVSVYIIDTGLTNVPTIDNVRYRSVSNVMGPRNTHGSFVSSILGARKKGPFSGIAPESQIYVADVSGSDGKIYTSSLIKAVRDAMELRVDIISISLGTEVYSAELEAVVKKASSQGALVFAASGNCSCRAYEFPSACDAAISVASMDNNREPSTFNTRNDSVTIFAPGQNILVPGADKRLSGTSFAVPFASGLAALELSMHRATKPSFVMTRHDAIVNLRASLGLECGKHTYSNDFCSGFMNGGSFEPGADGLSWFLILAVLSAVLSLCGAYYLRLYSWPKASTDLK